MKLLKELKVSYIQAEAKILSPTSLEAVKADGEKSAARGMQMVSESYGFP